MKVLDGAVVELERSQIVEARECAGSERSNGVIIERPV